MSLELQKNCEAYSRYAERTRLPLGMRAWDVTRPFKIEMGQQHCLYPMRNGKPCGSRFQSRSSVTTHVKNVHKPTNMLADTGGKPSQRNVAEGKEYWNAVMDEHDRLENGGEPKPLTSVLSRHSTSTAVRPSTPSSSTVAGPSGSALSRTRGRKRKLVEESEDEYEGIYEENKADEAYDESDTPLFVNGRKKSSSDHIALATSCSDQSAFWKFQYARLKKIHEQEKNISSTLKQQNEELQMQVDALQAQLFDL